VQKREAPMERMSKEETKRKRKSSTGGGTIEGTTKKGASMLYKEKYTKEQNEMF